MVQVHDESAGAAPSWYYAVYRDIDPVGGLRTSNTGAVANTTTAGPTVLVKAVLSWFAPPPIATRTPYGAMQ